MNAPARTKILPLLFCAMALASCAAQPQTVSDDNLKMETIRRPWGPTTYLYRQAPADQ